MPVSEKSLENLRLFQPGNKMSKGRPKGAQSLSHVLRKFLECKTTYDDPSTGDQTLVTYKELVALRLIEKAVNESDLGAIREILDRLEGKAVQSNLNVDINGNEIKARKTHEEWLKALKDD